jgi:hypothetical protein
MVTVQVVIPGDVTVRTGALQVTLALGPGGGGGGGGGGAGTGGGATDGGVGAGEIGALAICVFAVNVAAATLTVAMPSAVTVVEASPFALVLTDAYAPRRPDRAFAE